MEVVATMSHFIRRGLALISLNGVGGREASGEDKDNRLRSAQSVQIAAVSFEKWFSEKTSATGRQRREKSRIFDAYLEKSQFAGSSLDLLGVIGTDTIV